MIVVVVLLVFGMTFLSDPFLGAGLFWDTGNAVGYVALAGLAYLLAASTRPVEPAGHRLLGNVILGIAALHALWFLAFDAASVTYLRPGAPNYMWAGAGAILLLSGVTLMGLAEYRRWFRRAPERFRVWHRWLAIVTLALTLWHVAGSGFYLDNEYETALLITAGGYACFGRRLPPGGDTRRNSAIYIAAGLFAAALFVVLRNYWP